jgi:hypothetical protein
MNRGPSIVDVHGCKVGRSGGLTIGAACQIATRVQLLTATIPSRERGRGELAGVSVFEPGPRSAGRMASPCLARGRPSAADGRGTAITPAFPPTTYT